MPKRSPQDKLVHYLRKIKKLQEKVNKIRRKLHPFDSSDDVKLEGTSNSEPQLHEPQTGLKNKPIMQQSPLTQTPVVIDMCTSYSPAFGEPIHDSLPILWDPLLRKGLSKEEKSNLMKEYLIPSNCKLLQAPKMNAEISAVVSEEVRNRDKKMFSFQQALGAGISAINRGMDTMVKTDHKVRALKCLSDGCGLLTDLHHSFSCHRKKLITPSLEENFLDMIQDTERDETLFGISLPEKIKGSRVIEKNATPSLTTTWTVTQGRSAEIGVSSSEALDSDESIIFEELQSAQNPCQRAAITQGAPPPEHVPYPGCREALRAAFTRRGSPPSALDLMIASLSHNTLKQYSSTLKLWWQYCIDNKYDVHDDSIALVINFFTEQFRKGSTYYSLKSHRSALSLFLGDAIGSDDRIRRLISGASKLTSSRPEYPSTWDPQIVLNYISNWHPNLELNIDKITKKLAILLALCTSHRVRILSQIKLDNISIDYSGISIDISDIIKTSAACREQPELFLPYFRENINICPASALEAYISMTKTIRTSNEDRLFVITRRPFRAATAQSISRWIKQVLAESGVKMQEGQSVDMIRKTAGWTSTAFARFYNSRSFM